MSGLRTATRAAAAAATMITAALTVGAGPVYAAEPTVEFAGGSVLNLLVCKSEPNTSSVTVPSGGRVAFVNRLGQPATLKVDGKAVKSVGPNQAVPVVFQYGPVNVSMAFSCGVGVVEEFKSIAVSVTAAPAKTATAPKPKPTTAGAQKTTGTSGGSAGQAGTGSAATGSGGGSGSRTSQQGVPAAPVPAVPEAAPEVVDPDPSEAAAAPLLTEPPAGAETDDRVYVEQPVAASGPARNSPAGLLALVATVCVVGVGIAAIRAILAQRSSRASFA